MKLIKYFILNKYKLNIKVNHVVYKILAILEWNVKK